jgi:hypothetical protein
MLSEHFIRLYIPSEVGNLLAGGRGEENDHSINWYFRNPISRDVERRICNLTENVDGLH